MIKENGVNINGHQLSGKNIYKKIKKSKTTKKTVDVKVKPQNSTQIFNDHLKKTKGTKYKLTEDDLNMM